MRIGMILDSSFPPDSRVENEATSLIKAGFEVHLFSLCYKKKQPIGEEINGIKVHRFHAGKLIYKMSALAYTIGIFHYLVEPMIRSFLIENKIDIVHAHDMVIAEAAFRAAKSIDIHFILDLHENRPEIMKFYPHVNNLSGKLLINLNSWRRKQKELMDKADKVILVTEEAKEYAINHDGIEREKIVVVPNTVSPEIFYSYPIQEDIVKKYQNDFMVLYTGDTGIRRGTDTAIQATALLKDEIPNFKLVLVGKSKNDDVKLKELADKLNVSDKVEFCGWQDVSLFPSYIIASKLCISPLHRNVHHDTTYANKIFQYMAIGRPLLVSDSPPQAAIVENEKCGLVHQAGNPHDMADKLKMLKNEDVRLSMGMKGKNALNQKYNWNIMSNQLILLYKSISK
jgi:glycosyltransferase involved in cell wall biosynthesis